MSSVFEAQPHPQSNRHTALYPAITDQEQKTGMEAAILRGHKALSPDLALLAGGCTPLPKG